jgi:SAM-dependent methyltransferase
LGVIEHFESGPQAALNEAARVLKPGRWAFVSVPYLNPLRARHLQGLGQAVSEDLTFHQFYFSREQLDAQLERAGFIVTEHLPYAVEGFLVREHPIFRRFWSSLICRERIKKTWRRRFALAPATIRRRYAHMILAVAQKA